MRKITSQCDRTQETKRSFSVYILAGTRLQRWNGAFLLTEKISLTTLGVSGRKLNSDWICKLAGGEWFLLCAPELQLLALCTQYNRLLAGWQWEIEVFYSETFPSAHPHFHICICHQYMKQNEWEHCGKINTMGVRDWGNCLPLCCRCIKIKHGLIDLFLHTRESWNIDWIFQAKMCFFINRRYIVQLLTKI